MGLVCLIRDGDTIKVSGLPTRIHGLHVPETNTPVGSDAKDFVIGLLFGRSVSCYLSGNTTFGQMESVCFESIEV